MFIFQAMDKDEFNRFLGSYLRKVRLEKGLTQIDMASMIGVNPQNISAIERGEVSPTLYWINRLCLNLEIDPVTFYNNLYSSKNEV